MGIGLIPLAVSLENGLDFVVHLAFVLIFFLFLWYIFGVNYKFKEDRVKHNKTAFIVFLLIILLSILEVIGMALFFPSITLSLKSDKIIGIPIFLLVLLVGCFMVDWVGKKRLRR